MIARSADEVENEATEPYVSCIRIYGRAILPPLMTVKRREKMRHYKGLAELISTKLESKKNSAKSSQQTTSDTTQNTSKEPLPPSEETSVNEQITNSVPPDTSYKSVDTQEILEEFDPFAPSTLISERKSRHSGSSDELSASKTGSSNTSVALTNSTDLYHYMDITGSSLGDGRTTRRSLSPLTGAEWDSPPSKSNRQIEATYEDLNEYLDRILISSASSLPSRTKCSDDETTPTNGPPACDVQVPSVQDNERPKSCPYSPVPCDSVSDSAIGSLSEKLIDVIGEPALPETESAVPRLVRSNSYTLDAPSPMLLAHLEAEKKKNASAKESNKKPIVNNRSKVWNNEKNWNGVPAPKRKDNHSTENRSPQKIVKSPVTRSSLCLSVNRSPAPSCPQDVGEPTKTNVELPHDLIGQLEVRKLFANLQAEHNRQMEQLLMRQRKEQEMIRQAILAQRDLTRVPQTWAQCLGSKEQVGDVLNLCTVADSHVRPSRDIRKSLSSSFITASNANDDRAMTVSAPPGSLILTGPSLTRPSSSPSLTSCSMSVPISVPPREMTDTNGNLTKEQWNLPVQSGVLESASSRTELQVSPRTRRRAWDSHHVIAQDPDWLEINRQRQMHWAACKIQAAVRGYLTRRLLQTERVQGCITVIHDTILCALELQKECCQSIEPSDLQLHGRLIHQLSDACREIHAIFIEIPVAKRMAIIALDRERLESRSPRANGPRPLSRATQIALNRKLAQNSLNKLNPAVSTVSSTRRKNWANLNMKGKLSNTSCSQEPSDLIRSSTTTSASSNGDTHKPVGGGPRKPWR